MPDTLFIIEDETLLREELARYYRQQQWDVATATTLKEAEHALMQTVLTPLVVLSDMNLPDGNALDLLEKYRQHHNAEWIFLTGYGSVPDSVRALRLGAFEFLEKPCDTQRLDLIIQGAARSARAQRRIAEETAVRVKHFSPASFVGSSPAAQQVRMLLEKLTQVPFSALIITGETGTGKGLAARILHHAGARAAQPLVEVNCAALPRDLLESELFGHEAGAFTGAKQRRRGLLEQAHGGTLFLDEIGELDLDLQAKLLTALEDRKIRRLGSEKTIEVDIQLIAATNRNLQEHVEQGQFRADLYHRLSVFCLPLPSLRERQGDLEQLVPQFIAEFNAKSGKNVNRIPPSVWQRLHAHDWQGNVRELRNVIERCVLFADSELFPVEWLQLHASDASPAIVSNDNDTEGLCFPLDGSMSLDEMEKQILHTALMREDYNVMATARLLGMTRETLRYRLQKHGLRAGGKEKTG